MVVVRVTGWIILALAAMAVGAELLRSLEAGEWTPIAAGEVWYALDRGSLNFAQAISQRYLHPALWDPGMIAILRLPLWSVAAFFGVILLMLGSFGKRRKGQRWFRRN